jgi:hypothetical protein
MISSNDCRTLVLYSDPLPPPPPLLYVNNADVVISLLPGERHNLYVPSAMLVRSSSFFKSSLKPDWINGKVTGHEDIGNGTPRTMKRYELEFDPDGSNALVGKVSMLSTVMA